MANLAQVIEKAWGVGRVEPRLDPATATLGTTAAVVLPNNPKRLAALIVNLSLNAVFLKPLGPPSATSGVRLAPSGGTFSLIWSEDFHLVGYEWQGVADAAGSAILTIELVAL